MFRKVVTLLDIISLVMTGVWIVRGIMLGLSNADLVYNYIYSIVVFIAFVLTLIDKNMTEE